MAYQEVYDHIKGQVHDGMIKREYDGAFIPFDEGNIDYLEYMEWLKQGNNPTAHDAQPAVQAEQPLQKSAPKF